MSRNWKFRNTYGRMVRRMRTNLQKSQDELAIALGCSPSYVSQIELGKIIPGKDLKTKIDHMIEVYGTC